MLPFVVISAALAQTAPAPPGPALAAAAEAVFTAKCTQCHGRDLSHPKGNFGFITDLRRLAASPDYVVPGKPEESEIWKKISDGDMPPNTAKAGPLTDADKQAILAWIQAGAPASDPANPIAGPGPRADTAATAVRRPPAARPESTSGRSSLARALEFLGRFHVVVVHFPIALLLAAAGAEATSLARGRASPPATRFCLRLGAAAAVLAAELGWVHAWPGMTSRGLSPMSLEGAHRWLGTAAAVVAILAVILDRSRPGRAARVAILSLGIIVAGAGHFGGLLTHGTDYFSWPSAGPMTNGSAPIRGPP